METLTEYKFNEAIANYNNCIDCNIEYDNISNLGVCPDCELKLSICPECSNKTLFENQICLNCGEAYIYATDTIKLIYESNNEILIFFDSQEETIYFENINDILKIIEAWKNKLNDSYYANRLVYYNEKLLFNSLKNYKYEIKNYQDKCTCKACNNKDFKELIISFCSICGDIKPF